LKIMIFNKTDNSIKITLWSCVAELSMQEYEYM
jgi:hypothetical protein